MIMKTVWLHSTLNTINTKDSISWTVPAVSTSILGVTKVPFRDLCVPLSLAAVNHSVACNYLRIQRECLSFGNEFGVGTYISSVLLYNIFLITLGFVRHGILSVAFQGTILSETMLCTSFIHTSAAIVVIVCPGGVHGRKTGVATRGDQE